MEKAVKAGFGILRGQATEQNLTRMDNQIDSTPKIGERKAPLDIGKIDLTNLVDIPKEYTDKASNKKIQANFLKGGSGAKWILHKQINALIQQGYTRNMICDELGICRMTIYRHQYLY